MKNKTELDLYDTTLPLYFPSKILGLAPFFLKGKRGKRKFVSNVGFFVVIRLVGILGAIGYIGYLLEKHEIPYDIGGVAIRCELYLGAMLTTVVLCLAVANQNLVILSIKCIINIDKKMRMNGIHISYENARKFCYFQNISILSLFTTKGVLQVFSSSSVFIGVYSIFNLVDYLNTIMLFQYTDLILLLRQRYIWLNREINILQKIGDGDKLIYPNEFKIRKKPGLQFNGQDIEAFQDIVKPSAYLQTLGNIHNDLFDTGGVINRAYSIQLLMTVGVRFLMVTTQLLSTYKMLADKRNNSISFAMAGIYLTLHTLKVFMIASISSNTADKAKQTAIRLHKIWDSGPELKQHIHHFSLQILQQDLNFSAGGFFLLNYELMYNLLGALTTYLIILIQFDTAKQDPISQCNAILNLTLNRTPVKKEIDD